MKTLITGAGGSIGSALLREIIKRNPKQEPVLVELSEYNLYAAANIVGQTDAHAQYVLGDIRDRGKMMRVFEKHQPDVVFHCAALKHVPMLETPQNAIEGIKTNIIGTENVIEACHASGVQQLVIISTDKAVRPVSMMGATKTFVERLAHEDATTRAAGMQTIIVRFGNVQGSSGSVTELWAEQARAGKPITVTDRRMQRYFMSIDDAVGLCIDTSEIARKVSASSLMYVLNMGELVSVDDLARRLYPTSEIRYTGIRPGEKLVEDLIDPAIEVRDVVARRYWRINRMHQRRPREYRIAAAALRELSGRGEFETALRVIRDATGYSGIDITSAGL